MSRLRLLLACLLVFSATSAFAQSYPPPVPGAQDPPCVPYNNVPGEVTCPPGAQPPCSLSVAWCVYFPHVSTTSVAEYGDFANVFLGVPGLEWTFISLKNKADVASTVVVEVTIAGRAPIYKDFQLGPQDRTDARLNEWPELAAHRGGVSIVVRADQRTGVSVAMHPQITDVNNPTQLTEFWQKAKFLEGR